VSRCCSLIRPTRASRSHRPAPRRRRPFPLVADVRPRRWWAHCTATRPVRPRRTVIIVLGVILGNRPGPAALGASSRWPGVVFPRRLSVWGGGSYTELGLRLRSPNAVDERRLHGHLPAHVPVQRVPSTRPPCRGRSRHSSTSTRSRRWRPLPVA
jgi:hypothetical protein